MIESNAIKVSNQRKLPVLIVCYLRPKNLELILKNPELSDREVYVFIDLCETGDKFLNEEVYKCALSFSKIKQIHVYRSKKNLGVATAVPTAIDWISSKEETFIILEDDCIPRMGTMEWFDQESRLLGESNVMLSGFSPTELSKPGKSVDFIECKYPMIWGWVTTRKGWETLRPKRYSIFKLIGLLLRSRHNQPNRLAKAFFIAAQIRVQRNKLFAWDCCVALNMLSENLRALVPTSCLIENMGNDSVASHEQIKIIQSSTTPQNNLIHITSSEMERRIEQEIYMLKKRHFLSPIRAMLNL